MSQFRASSIYISSATRRSLKMIARGEGVEKTADEVGDRLLSEVIAERYPGLVNLQKEIDALENDMIEKIKAAQQ
jgi:hypothetical protein